MITDNLGKAGWSLGLCCSQLIPTGERSGLPTHIATTESVSLCARMNTWLRFWSLRQRLVLLNDNALEPLGSRLTQANCGVWAHYPSVFCLH
jgi:hypothetical protein